MKYLPFFLVFIIFSCKNQSSVSEKKDGFVLVGLDGKKYEQPKFSEEKLLELTTNLDIALQNYKAEKTEENIIWYGRRLAYLYKINDAIDVFSEGLNLYPDSYKILRHRGHRYISIRRFDDAITDLTKAAKLAEGFAMEIEPDGIPNKMNTPLSNYHFNIYYHLGLAHYLIGNYKEAESAYEACLRASNNNDLYIATVDWLYMTKLRLGKIVDATHLLTTIASKMDVIENDSYLQRLKLYMGMISVDEVLNIHSTDSDRDLKLATQGYGVANWYLQNGDTTMALQIFKEISHSSSFTSFGFIAAESDLTRMK